MENLYSLILGYLLGSLPFAVWIAKSKGVDIFKVGSGNPGATNVKRSVGKKEGNICFVLDALKGLVPVAIVGVVWPNQMWAAPAALLGALLGHSFSAWIGFRGGKGVATTIGGLLAYMPTVMLGGLIVWGAVFFLWRFVSLASIIMAVWLPVGAFFFANDSARLAVAGLMAVIVVARHRANIERLIKGTESRFTKGDKKELSKDAPKP